MKARVSQLHKTEASWNRLTDFIPVQGELIVFDPDSTHNYARLKIGDGVTKLSKLPFFIDSTVTELLTQQGLTGIIDGGRI